MVKTLDFTQNRSSDSRAVVFLTIDDELVIKLLGLPSTGYVWELEELGAGVRNLKLLDQATQNEIWDPEIVGGEVDEIFRFRVQGPLAGELRLVYHRPWENEEPLYACQIRAETIAITD